MVGGPLAVLVLVPIICWFVADRRAEDEFFKRYAEAHQMTHSPHWTVYELTPLLGGGDRRKCDHWMESDRGGTGIGWYTYEVRHESGESNRETWESFEFTISMVDLGELGMRRFQGIYLQRKRGFFDHLDSDSNWLSKHKLEKIELESTAFCEKYDLFRERDQNEVVTRQLFAPSFVVWLTEHPLSPGFELRAGTLVVFIPGHCGEAGRLDWLLMAARDIAKRIQ